MGDEGGVGWLWLRIFTWLEGEPPFILAIEPHNTRNTHARSTFHVPTTTTVTITITTLRDGYLREAFPPRSGC